MITPSIPTENKEATQATSNGIVTVVPPGHAQLIFPTGYNPQAGIQVNPASGILPGQAVHYGDNIYVVGPTGRLTNQMVNVQGRPIGTGPIVAHTPQNLIEPGASTPGPKAPPAPSIYQTAGVNTPVNNQIKVSQPGSLTPSQYQTPSGTLSGLSTGVYTGGKGEQVVIQQGKAATSAGQLIGRLQGQPYTPTRITSPLTITTITPTTNEPAIIQYLNGQRTGGVPGTTLNSVSNRMAVSTEPPLGERIKQSAAQQYLSGSQAIENFFGPRVTTSLNIFSPYPGVAIPKAFDIAKGFAEFGVETIFGAGIGVEAIAGEAVLRTQNLFTGKTTQNFELTKQEYTTAGLLPLTFVKEIPQQASTFRGLGELTAPIILGGLSESVKIGSRVTEVPQEGGTIAKVNTFGIEVGSRSTVLGSKVTTAEGNAYFLGRANLEPILRNLPVSTGVSGTDIKFGGPLETNQFINALQQLDKRITPRAGEAPILVRTILRQTQYTNADTTVALNFRTERLEAPGVKALLGIAKEKGATVFGSFSRQQQGVNLVPRDIDIRLANANQEEILGTAELGATRLRALGYEARVIPEKGAIEVYSQEVGTFTKVAEFKGEELLPGEEAVPEYVLGLKKEGTPVTIGGQRFTSLSEELRGVGQGAFRIRQTAEGTIDVSPSVKRAKDVLSFVESGEVLRQNQFLARPTLKGNLVRVRELYPEYLNTEESGQVLLSDFSPRAPTSSLPKVILTAGFGEVSVSSSASGSSTGRRVTSFSEVSPSSSSRVISSRISTFSRGLSSSSLSSSSSALSNSFSGSSSPSSSSPRASSSSLSSSFRSSFPSSSPSISSSSSGSAFSSPFPSSSSSSSSSPSRSSSSSSSVQNYGSPYFSTSTKKAKPRKIIVDNYGTDKKDFEVSIRRFGKFSLLGSSLSKSTAVGLGKSSVERSLGATFKVSERGVPLSFGQLGGNLGVNFRPGKNSSDLIIQKRDYRLSSTEERIAIQRARIKQSSLTVRSFL